MTMLLAMHGLFESLPPLMHAFSVESPCPMPSYTCPLQKCPEPNLLPVAGSVERLRNVTLVKEKVREIVSGPKKLIVR